MVEVVKAGFFSTIQDLGRFGYRDYGVPVSGVMDDYSAQFANTILDNNPNCAVLEMTMVGATLRFNANAQVVVSGADMSPMLNNSPLKMNTVVSITKGETLSFSKVLKGFRSYLAVKGGFKTEPILNSRSFYKPITTSVQLKTGDKLDIEEYTNTIAAKHASVKYDDAIVFQDVLECYKGPEFDELSKLQQDKLLSERFEVSKFNNRMAYQLLPNIKHNVSPIITSGVLPGTVQLTPSGQLIVLMKDAQTTGGYPRVLQLTEHAISVLAQKKTGDTLQFKIKG